MPKYNLRAKEERPAAYRTAINHEVISQISDQLMRKMIVEKCYLHPDCTARRMAEEIGTNTRYISAAVSLRFQTSFPSLVAGYRVREAIALLTDKRVRDLTIEDIARASGFASRQAFYVAFYRMQGMTPRKYQEEFFARINSKAKKAQ